MIRFNNRYSIMFVLILSAMLLAACEEQEEKESPQEPQNAVQVAETVLTLINNNDVATASQYLCEKDIQILRENPPIDESPKFTGVDCSGNESIVTCSYNIEINGRTAERGLTVEFDVDEEGKICQRLE